MSEVVFTFWVGIGAAAVVMLADLFIASRPGGRR